MQRREQRRLTRRRDRRRRQPDVSARVVGRVDFQISRRQRPVIRRQHVIERRIRLQRHPLMQPVVEHFRDLREIRLLPPFALDD